MRKIIQGDELRELLQKIREEKKEIVLVGGCFDILHKGHISFLQKAKEKADLLLVMLESDENVKKIKGEKRPIHSQKKRALILSSLPSVDYVLLMPPFKKNQEYDLLVKEIKPAIIATTEDDPNRVHKERQAKDIGAKVVDVIKRIPNASTTELIKLL